MDLRFGRFTLKSSDRQLLGPDGPIELSGRAFDILTMLLGMPDNVVPKSVLLDAVWPGLVVEENTLQVHVSSLRKALDEGMITTVHGRGYKYAGPRPEVDNRPAGTVFDDATEGSQPRRSRPSIAVLPFENMSSDREQTYFSDGITEDIISELGRFREFLVIARNSSFRFRNPETDVGEIARKMGVQYVVEGSVRKTGNRVRVTVQLIDAQLATHLWGEHYDRDLTDIFVIQDEITQMIATRVARQARTAIAVRARTRPTENMTAYDAYLRALQMSADYDTTDAAQPLLETALDLDPGYAAAHAMLGFVHAIRFFWVYRRPDLLMTALQMAELALSIDPDETYGHLTAGLALLYLHRFKEAEVSLNRAHALNPNDPFILTIRALLFNYTGRPERALEEVDEAQRRDPFAVGWLEDFRGIMLTTAGQHREAVTCYEKSEAVTPWSLGHLAICYAVLGEDEQARQTLSRFKARWPGFDLDEIITNELDFFEDPAVCSRYREILRRIDGS